MLKKTAEISVVLSDLIKSMEFKIKHRMKDNYFTRTVKLTFSIMMNLMIKKSNKSIQNSLNDIKLSGDVDYTITNSAYTQARAKLSHTAFQEMSDKTVELFYRDGEYNRFKDLRILAVDGSIVILPNTDDVKKEFKPTYAKNQDKDFSKDVVQSRVSCLYDVLNNITIDASINNMAKNEDNTLAIKEERALAYEHFEYCDMDDLVIMDRGYCGFEMFARVENKTNILCRIRRGVFNQANFLFDPNSQVKDVILEIPANSINKKKMKKLGLSTKLKIRFVQVILDNGEVELLATNILSSNSLQTSDFKELYFLRWGIETYYDVIKNRLSLENFTGLTALAVKQDFYATIFLTNYEAMLVYDTNLELQDKSKENKYVQQVNKAVSFNAIKHKAFDIFYEKKEKKCW